MKGSGSNPNFAEVLRRQLEKDCLPALADKLYSSYVSTRTKLREQVYDNIPAAEPNLTDHGSRHVDNVLENAVQLLGKDGLDQVTGRELYCLGMSILFHDAGNVDKREGHRDKVGHLHEQIRGSDTALLREKTLITRAARAHTGFAQDGTTDTLKEVSNEEHLYNGAVRLREVAALLRLADELAEGPHRTSEFMQIEGRYDVASLKHHEYASRAHVHIDRNSGRLALTYETDVDARNGSKHLRQVLDERLTYAYGRVLKLNQERQYARFRSKLLSTFDTTDVVFNFHHRGELLDMGLMPLKLTDVVLPGESTKEITEIDSSYALEKVIGRLLQAIGIQPDMVQADDSTEAP